MYNNSKIEMLRLEIVEIQDFHREPLAGAKRQVRDLELVYELLPDNVGYAGIPPLQG